MAHELKIFLVWLVRMCIIPGPIWNPVAVFFNPSGWSFSLSEVVSPHPCSEWYPTTYLRYCCLVKWILLRCSSYTCAWSSLGLLDLGLPSFHQIWKCFAISHSFIFCPILGTLSIRLLDALQFTDILFFFLVFFFFFFHKYCPVF